MRTPIPQRPPLQATRRYPYPERSRLNKFVGVTILTLTSPLWVPIWILHLPFRLFRERKVKKESLSRQALRESAPPPPPDLELECRRFQAREEQNRLIGRGRRYRDPIKKNLEIAKCVRAAGD